MGHRGIRVLQTYAAHLNIEAEDTVRTKLESILASRDYHLNANSKSWCQR